MALLGCGDADAVAPGDAATDGRPADAGAPDGPPDAAPRADATPACGVTLLEDALFVEEIAVTARYLYAVDAPFGEKNLRVRRVDRTLRTSAEVGTIDLATTFVPTVTVFLADDTAVYLGLHTIDLDDPQGTLRGLWRLPSAGGQAVRVSPEVPVDAEMDATHLYTTTDYPGGGDDIDPSLRRWPRAGGDPVTLDADMSIFPRLALTSDDIVYNDSLFLLRRPKAGGDEVFMDHVSPGGTTPVVDSMIAEGDQVYWFTGFDSTFWRASAAKPKREKLHVSRSFPGGAFRVEGGALLWSELSGIYRLLPPATTPEKVFTTSSVFEIDGDTLFVKGFDRVRAVPLRTCTE